MVKKMYSFTLENSFAICLGTALASVIWIMMGSILFTTMQQMAVIMATMYGCCWLYQRYRRAFEETYSLLGGRNLEVLFVILTIFIMSVALYVDVNIVARL